METCNEPCARILRAAVRARRPFPGEGSAISSQPLRIIVAFPLGGSAYVAARIVAQHLGESLEQTMVVENVTGAGGTIGTAGAAQAAPDGYTLLEEKDGDVHRSDGALFPGLLALMACRAGLS